MGKIQFEVRFLVEIEAPVEFASPICLADKTGRDEYIKSNAQALQRSNLSLLSLRGVTEVNYGVKDYTGYILGLTIEAYRDILHLMKERGYVEFDFREHGVLELPQVTSTDNYPTKQKCVKIVSENEALSFLCDDGNSYSLSGLGDTDVFYILNAFTEGLSCPG